jgi:hypothetical protein
LSEPLHCVTCVTRLVDLVVNVPSPGEHGANEHFRVTVVVELRWPRWIVLTTVTVQVIPVVAPCAPGPTLLHWVTVRDEAAAAGGARANPGRHRALTNPTVATAMPRQAWEWLANREESRVNDMSHRPSEQTSQRLTEVRGRAKAFGLSPRCFSLH